MAVNAAKPSLPRLDHLAQDARGRRRARCHRRRTTAVSRQSPRRRRIRRPTRRRRNLCCAKLAALRRRLLPLSRGASAGGAASTVLHSEANEGNTRARRLAKLATNPGGESPAAPNATKRRLSARIVGWSPWRRRGAARHRRQSSRHRGGWRARDAGSRRVCFWSPGDVGGGSAGVGGGKVAAPGPRRARRRCRAAGLSSPAAARPCGASI